MPRFTHTSALASLALCSVIAFSLCAFAAPPPKAAPSADNVAPAGAVVVGNFEGKITPSKQYGPLVMSSKGEFGWGWSTTSDQRIGGHSTATIAIVHPGADGTHGALQVTGEIKPGFVSWAGAVWFPGHYPTQPADLSGKTELTFWARGTPGSYNLMLSTGSAQSMPVYSAFVVTKQWKEYRVPLATSFPNADWKKVVYLAFSAATPGKFQFDLDQVELH